MSGQGSPLGQLAAVARAVSSTLDLDTVLRQVIASAVALRPQLFCAIRLVDPEARGYRLAASGGDEFPPRDPVVPFGQGLTGVVAQTRRPLFVPDARRDPRALGAAGPLPVYYGVPIEAGDSLLGVLNIALPEGATLDAVERETIELLAGQAAVAIHNAEVFAASESRRRSAEALAEVGAVFSQTLDPGIVGGRIVEMLRTHLGFLSSAVYRLDDVTGDAVVVATANPPDAPFQWSPNLPRGAGTVGLAIRLKETVTTPDVLADPRVTLTDTMRTYVTGAGYRAVLALPLIVRDRVIGALGIGERAGRVFTPEEIRVVHAFGTQAAIALENARLYSLETSRLRQLEALAEIERELAAELDTDRLLGLIADRASRLFGGNGGIYFVEGPGRLVVRAWSNQREATPKPVLTLGEGIVGHCAASGRGLIVNDYQTSPIALTGWLGAGVTRAMAEPVAGRNNTLLGVIAMNRLGAAAPPFTPDDFTALATFARQTEIALENSALYAEAERRRREAEVIAVVARTINASLDLKTVLERVADAARELTSADGAVVALPDPDSGIMILRYLTGSRYADIIGLPVEIGKGLGGLALATRRPQRTNDYSADRRINTQYPDQVRALGVMAQMVVPIQAADEVQGLLYVARTERRGFTDGDETTLIQLADHASIAIRNTELFSREQAARAEAESSGRRFVDLVQGLDAVVWESDPITGRFSFVSARAEALLGYPVARWMSEPDFLVSHVHPEDRARVNAARREAAERATNQDLEYRFLTAAGGLEWVRDILHVVTDAEQRVRRLRGVMIDVTARKEAESALIDRARTAAFVAAIGVALNEGVAVSDVLQGCAQAMVDHLDGAFARIWTVDTEAQMLELQASAGLYTHLDGPHSRVPIGQFKIGLIAQERRPHLTNQVMEDPRVGDKEWARREGMVAFAGHPLLVEDRVVGVMAMFARQSLGPGTLDALGLVADEVAQCIERKRAESALRTSEERFRTQYKNLPVPTYSWRHVDNDFVLVDYNTAAEMATRGLVAGYVGTRASEFYADNPDVRMDLARCLAEGTTIRREIASTLGTSGEPLRLSVTYVPVPPDLVMVHTEDITERERLEEQLRQSQKMEAVGRLAGGIAHDFNNLLTVITGRSQLLRARMRGDDPLRRDVELVLSTAQRAASLTHQLLAFSRKQVLQPRVLELSAVVADMEPMLRRLIGEDLNLVVRARPDHGHVRADPGQLEQVIVNLVVNARDAMPRGGRLTIETAAVQVEVGMVGRPVDVPLGRYTVLAVTDTGHGMDADTRSRIFEPFFTTKAPGKGTGLGLATVYGIVRQHQGHIVLDSEPGQGTTFAVYLPSVEPEVEAAEPPRPAPRGARGAETVLVVEDEDGVRQLAVEILEMGGYTVLEATRGSEALEVAERYRGTIDLLVTDVVMPEMSGRELADRLSSVRPELSVIYLSGYTDEAIGHHGVLDAGITLLQKPFEPDALSRTVREVLDARRR